jgi:hypothetical protein
MHGRGLGVESTGEPHRGARKREQSTLGALNWWITAIFWTLYVAALTTYVVLGATGNLHHH